MGGGEANHTFERSKNFKRDYKTKQTPASYSPPLPPHPSIVPLPLSSIRESEQMEMAMGMTNHFTAHFSTAAPNPNNRNFSFSSPLLKTRFFGSNLSSSLDNFGYHSRNPLHSSIKCSVSEAAVETATGLFNSFFKTVFLFEVLK